MALSGSFTIYTPHPTDTEIVSSSVTYPVDIPVGHDLYDVRGTTEIISHSVSVQVPNTYDNQYIILKNTSINKDVDPDGFTANYEWEAYNSQNDSRDIDVTSNFSQVGAFKWDWNLYTNIYEESYSHLSSSLVSSSLTNV